MKKEKQCKRKAGVGEPFVGKSQVNSCLGRERGEGGEKEGDSRTRELGRGSTLGRGCWGVGWGGGG